MPNDEFNATGTLKNGVFEPYDRPKEAEQPDEPVEADPKETKEPGPIRGAKK